MIFKNVWFIFEAINYFCISSGFQLVMHYELISKEKKKQISFYDEQANAKIEEYLKNYFCNQLKFTEEDTTYTQKAEDLIKKIYFKSQIETGNTRRFINSFSSFLLKKTNIKDVNNCINSPYSIALKLKLFVQDSSVDFNKLLDILSKKEGDEENLSMEISVNKEIVKGNTTLFRKGIQQKVNFLLPTAGDLNIFGEKIHGNSTNKARGSNRGKYRLIGSRVSIEKRVKHY